MIHIISQKATKNQIEEMLEELDPLIKLARGYTTRDLGWRWTNACRL